MRQGYECAHCAAWIEFSAYARAKMFGERPFPDRCRKCGAVHALHRGEVEVISPPMFPINTSGRISPWMLHYTRPVRVGLYECKFRDVEGALFLWWDGHGFRPSEHDTRYVQMATFATWRGIWP